MFSDKFMKFVFKIFLCPALMCEHWITQWNKVYLRRGEVLVRVAEHTEPGEHVEDGEGPDGEDAAAGQPGHPPAYLHPVHTVFVQFQPELLNSKILV